MNGAEALVKTLLASGVDTCFANPGTSEMHFVAALDQIEGMRCVLGLFEGVATGAADGYARMADKPAGVLLHCGPGLGNGVANLHNAKRAETPVVNIVGDHATYHAPLDPPLASDIEGLALPVSCWVKTSTQSASVGQDAARAVEASLSRRGVATLVLPSDVCWDEGGVVARPMPLTAPVTATDDAVAKAARMLRSGKRCGILVGGLGLREGPLRTLAAIAAETGARFMAPNANARIERGAGRPAVTRLPYFVEDCQRALEGLECLILVGVKSPVSFFAYPGKPRSPLPENAIVHSLVGPAGDVGDALDRLADALGCRGRQVDVEAAELPPVASGPITSAAFAQSLAALLPENAIVVDEGNTFGIHCYSATQDARPHDWLQLTGGAIGIGIPLATGAAIGAPGRRVVTLQADGSAAYTAQGLWTQARERLDVTTIIFSNRRYQILLLELGNVGATPGHTAHQMMSLDDPPIDWVQIGQGFGVKSARAETMEELNALMAQAFAHKGPFLIEAVIP